MNSDAMHPYFRYLAMLAAGQPRLRPPPGGQLLTASPGQLAELMPFTHPISGYRDRSFEFRELVLRFMVGSGEEEGCRMCAWREGTG